MSYSIRKKEKIRVRFDKTVSYPKSETGGTLNVSKEWDEEIEVNIEVDTTPFDNSISGCKTSVNGLTGSVGAMNAAQCLSIKQGADKISESLISGFFNSVRTDLGTQVSALKQRIESRLLLLNQQADMLKGKRQKMEQDYQRTAQRYQKIFDDLDHELSNRIHEIDQPVFQLVADVDTSSERMLHTSLVQTASTTSQETALVGSQLASATMKRHALEAMNQAGEFLAKNAATSRTLRQAIADVAGSNAYMVPVCYMQTVAASGQTDQHCQLPELSTLASMKLGNDMQNAVAKAVTPTTGDEQQKVAAYLQGEIAQRVTGSGDHAMRIRATINKLSSL